MLFSSRNELLLEETWTPGCAPGPGGTQKSLFSSRNELFLEETWTPGWAPLAGLMLGAWEPSQVPGAAPKSLGFTTGALLRAGNLQTWTPGWAPGPGWTKKEPVLKQK